MCQSWCKPAVLLVANRVKVPNLHFLKNNALSMGRALERVSLPACSQVSLLVVLVMPLLVSAAILQLARCAQSHWFT